MRETKNRAAHFSGGGGNASSQWKDSPLKITLPGLGNGWFSFKSQVSAWMWLKEESWKVARASNIKSFQNRQGQPPVNSPLYKEPK